MPTDILRDENGDFLKTGDDVVYGESTRHHQKKILLARKGDIRRHPTVGVGLEDYIDDEDPEEMLRETSRQFIKDGMRVHKMAFDEMIATYKK